MELGALLCPAPAFHLACCCCEAGERQYSRVFAGVGLSQHSELVHINLYDMGGIHICIQEIIWREIDLPAPDL